MLLIITCNREDEQLATDISANDADHQAPLVAAITGSEVSAYNPFRVPFQRPLLPAHD